MISDKRILMKPLLSIACITYNHAKFIRQALDNFLMQKTNFPFEIIIHDDASTDGTADIIREYEAKYPDIIKPIYQKENQWQKGVSISRTFQFPRIKGKYVAMCEGDDYWCDEYKLQKQVDFMEAHPDYALCYHPAKMIYVDEEREPITIGKSKYNNPQPYYNLIKGNYIPSNSVLYRTKYLKQELKNYPNDIYPNDWFNHIVVSKHGKIGYIPDVMYVYRRHKQGISYADFDNYDEEIHLRYGIKEMNFHQVVWNKIKDQYPQYYKEIFIPKLIDIYLAYVKNNKFSELEILKQNYSQYFKDIELRDKTGDINKFKKKCKKYKKFFKLSIYLNIFLTIFMLYFVFFMR